MASLPAPLLAPSLLAGDHANLAASAQLVANAGLSWLHCDIMDGHFVPNLSFSPETLAALRRAGNKLYFDTHLMLDEPHRYIEAFAKAGANLISIHIEPAYDHAATLARIRSLGCQCGIVLNPGTPATAIEPFLSLVDLVLVMTVQPGFGGQSFRRDMLPKIQQIDTWRRARALGFRLEVDGGIDLATGRECHAAGADTFVAGTSFFRAADKPAFVAGFASLPVR
ncbi:ribulose-phosphate 3-epimerase [Opitutus sp. ER46]|uniref:ribulose-phosphate 3-epimerase n=1 Tax=Opitutus sp. ER46 TaxID=2161864 RepID=UPI000D2FF367|nr:ribulose-phosphate 3-epimerase [Opitutus sp. ER46]PTX91160.1 ribulose-phosphate 3-epimerase [Opitutus sp. ER46]